MRGSQVSKGTGGTKLSNYCLSPEISGKETVIMEREESMRGERCP